MYIYIHSKQLLARCCLRKVTTVKAIKAPNTCAMTAVQRLSAGIWEMGNAEIKKQSRNYPGTDLITCTWA